MDQNTLRTKLKDDNYNNLYEFLEEILSKLNKTNSTKKIFIRSLKSFYNKKNGFWSIDLFKESEEFDCTRELLILELEKSLLCLGEKKIRIFLDFCKKNYSSYIKGNTSCGF